jgi:N-acyl homoserine lactone hydrolase
MTSPTVETLLRGCPASSDRGFAGLSAVVLVRGKENILVDTGSVGDRTGLIASLAARGLTLASIDTVVLTHLHFDHAGNAEVFPDARILVHQAEVDHATSDHGDPGYSAQIIDAVLRSRLLSKLSEDHTDLERGVAVFRTPGHTPGSVSVSVQTSEDGTVTIAGDAVKNRSDLARGFPLPAAHDSAAWTDSAAHMVTNSSVIYPGHDVALRVNTATFEPITRGRSPYHFAETLESLDCLSLPSSFIGGKSHD